MHHPPASVLAAFQAEGPVVSLAGGQGEAVRCGNLVLKPASDIAETTWLAPILARLPQVGFRLARPVPAHDGRWVVDGWQAAMFMPGDHRTDRWAETLATSRAFHQAVASVHIGRPALLGQRDNPWARADQVAWGNRAVKHPRVAATLAPLLAWRQPIDLPDQLVHGDLPQNVLFHEDAPGTVIDVSPYWRPAAWAEAIIVADALDWYGADLSILNLVSHVSAFDQLLLRAEIFRIATYDGLYHPLDDLTVTLAAHTQTLHLLHDRLAS